MKTLTLGKGKEVVYEESEGAIIEEFAKLYRDHKKSRNGELSESRAQKVEEAWKQVKYIPEKSKVGNVGSGEWYFEFKEMKIVVHGDANRRGFWARPIQFLD